MVRVRLSESVERQLCDAGDRVEIVNSAGEVIGHFEPCADHQTPKAFEAACPYTDEQLAELARQSGGRPLEEILRDLPQ